MSTAYNKTSIQAALKDFSSSRFRESNLTLLKSLGYFSEKTQEIPGSKPETFLEITETSSTTSIDREKAQFKDWNKVEILFQVTDQEFSEQRSLFAEQEIKPGLLQSYLFFGIELGDKHYSRTNLANITRQINRVFPMPVMVIFFYANKLSIAVINRRRNKREEHKDVLGRVTLIHEINLSRPHRGHLDILESFSIEKLREQQRIDNFDSLHIAWEEIFNVELLNKRFYRELSNWYFWALEQVEFPDDVEKNRETRNATSLIRMLTRLIFCWFIKEKGLVPSKLFHEEELTNILTSFKPKESIFYLAILQNLFFATLNQRMNAKGYIHRKFANDGDFLKNR